MIAISKRWHQALIAALQQLEELQHVDVLPSLSGGEPAGSFLQQTPK
ncbi:hypothetical protein [Sphingobacterium alkalisoli]|nr:hypothetical protein [Sphingobacterium alkalisoli]